MTLAAAAVTAYNTAAAAAAATGLASGTVEVLNAGGTVLYSAPLGTPTASGAVTTMGGYPRTVTAAADGTAASARYRNSAAANWKTDMPVGLSAAAAPAWATSTVYAVGNKRTAGANQYNCTTAGTSASSGSGPTGTGTGITDGTAVWEYISPANAQVQVSSLGVTSGQSVQINSATLTHNGASA
jgi:hypothetical protein